MQTFASNSQKETVDLGIKLGRQLTEGDVVCLSGDLGTGKTALVKGIALGLGVNVPITSPTFNIVNEYQGKQLLYHFDVYRVHDTEELFEIGFDDYIFSDAVSIIEWAELIESILPKDNIWIKIQKDYSKGEDYRNIVIECNGNKHNDYLTKLLTPGGE